MLVVGMGIRSNVSLMTSRRESTQTNNSACNIICVGTFNMSLSCRFRGTVSDIMVNEVLFLLPMSKRQTIVTPGLKSRLRNVHRGMSVSSGQYRVKGHVVYKIYGTCHRPRVPQMDQWKDPA